MEKSYKKIYDTYGCNNDCDDDGICYKCDKRCITKESSRFYCYQGHFKDDNDVNSLFCCSKCFNEKLLAVKFEEGLFIVDSFSTTNN